MLQPSVFATLGIDGAMITAGWWSNVELGSPDSGDPGSVGLGRRWFGENDIWLELSGQVGPVGLTGGFVRYLFARERSFPAARLFDTSELYGRVWVNAGSFVPEIGIWQDVDEIRGAYMTAGADYRVPTIPSHETIIALYLTAHAGVSLGQEVDRDRLDAPAYFAERGLSHIDLGFKLLVGRTGGYATLEGHVLLGVDTAASFDRSGDPGDAHSTIWWVGLTMSAASVVAVF